MSMYCFFYVKKSRNQDLPKQSSCISKLMVLLYCTYQFWLVPWSVALVSQTTRDDVYHITCIDLWHFFFHYSIMYYNMYCYHVASIHNQSWTGLLIMETVDQSVSCNLVGVFFFLYLNAKFYCATIWNKKFYDKFCYYVKVLTCIW